MGGGRVRAEGEKSLIHVPPAPPLTPCPPPKGEGRLSDEPRRFYADRGPGGNRPGGHRRQCPVVGTTASIQNTDDTMRRTIAYGMAQQLMDEVVGCRYMDLGGSPYDTTLKPSARRPPQALGNCSTTSAISTATAASRRRISTALPWARTTARAGSGIPTSRPAALSSKTGSSRSTCTTSATRTSARALPAGQTSDYRAVEVRIMYNDPAVGPHAVGEDSPRGDLCCTAVGQLAVCLRQPQSGRHTGRRAHDAVGIGGRR